MSNTAALDIANQRAKYFYLGCIALFGYRFLSSTLWSQLSQPILIYPGLDLTYWVFHLLGIPRLATQSMVGAALLDLCLFLLPVLAILLPDSRRVWAIAFSLLVFLYQITISTYSLHHYHSLVAVLVLSIPFWFAPAGRMERVWLAARYYFFFFFCSAALWKLCRGSAFDPTQLSHILMAQHAQYIYDYPDSAFSTLYRYLIAHPAVSYPLLLSATMLQLSFLIGFFTARYDRVFLFLFLTFLIVNYIVMHVFSFELLPFCLLLIEYAVQPGGGDSHNSRAL